MGALKPWHFIALLVCFLIAAAAIGGLVWLIVHLSRKSRPPQPLYPGPPHQAPYPYHQQPSSHPHADPAHGDAPGWDSGDGGSGSGGGDGGGGGGE